MQLFVNSALFAIVICFGLAEVWQADAEQKRNRRFEGDELLIQIDKCNEVGSFVIICFSSTSDFGGCNQCPQGYTPVAIGAFEDRQVWKLNRRGKITKSGYHVSICGDIVFGRDGTINVLLVETLYGISVSLLNAEVPITTTAVAPKKKDSNSKTTISIIIAVVILVLIVIIVSAALLYYCWNKKRSPTSVPVQAEACEPEELLRPNATKALGPPPLKRAARVPSATTSTTKAFEDKPRFVNGAKPAPTAPVLPVSSIPHILTPDSTSRQKSQKSKKSKKSQRHGSTVLKTSQSDKQMEHSSPSSEHGEDSVPNPSKHNNRSDKRRSNIKF